MIYYDKLARMIALRANQLGDAIDAATLETAYASGTLATIMEGMEVTPSSLRADILREESAIATMIGMSSNMELRRALAGERGIDSGGQIPIYVSGSTTKRFVGKPDGIFNATTGFPLEAMPIDVIRRRLRNEGNYFRGRAEGYAIEGTRIFYVCQGKAATYRGCAFDEVAAAAAYDSGVNGVSVLPDQLATLWMDMVLANISQETWFTGQSGNYAARAADAAQNMGLFIDPSGVSDALSTNRENRHATSEAVR